MKLTLESKYNSITIEVPYEDLDVGEVVEQLFRPAMLAATYAPSSLEKVIGVVDDDKIYRDDSGII